MKKKSGKSTNDPASGYLGDLSEEQAQVLKELKEWITENVAEADPWVTDASLLRFCRAR